MSEADEVYDALAKVRAVEGLSPTKWRHRKGQQGMNGFYTYRVELHGWQTELITPMPIFGLDANVIYPLEEWHDTSGGNAFLLFTMPDERTKRVYNHPYQISIDGREQDKW